MQWEASHTTVNFYRKPIFYVVEGTVLLLFNFIEHLHFSAWFQKCYLCSADIYR